MYIIMFSFSQSFVFQHGKDGGQSVLTKLKCAAGLADLATKKYKSAAKYFLQASFDHCDFPEVRLKLQHTKFRGDLVYCLLVHLY